MYCFYNIAVAPMEDWNRAAELLKFCFTECSKKDD